MKKLLLGVMIGAALVPAIGFTASTIDAKLVARLKGRILLQTQSKGEAWYVNPSDGKRYYMKDGATAYEMMRTFGMGITNADLEKIPAGNLGSATTPTAPSAGKSYQLIATFSGDGAKNSEPFTITGDRFKIAYECEPGYCGGYLNKVSGGISDLIVNTTSGANAETIMYGKGQYYIQANTTGAFTFRVYDYK